MNTDTKNIPSVLCPGAPPGLAPEDTFLDCPRPVATTCPWGPHRRLKVNPVASQFWLHLRNAKCRLAPKQQHPSTRAAKPGACPRAHTRRPGHLEAWAGLQRHTEEGPEGPLSFPSPAQHAPRHDFHQLPRSSCAGLHMGSLAHLPPGQGPTAALLTTPGVGRLRTQDPAPPPHGSHLLEDAPHPPKSQTVERLLGARGGKSIPCTRLQGAARGCQDAPVLPGEEHTCPAPTGRRVTRGWGQASAHSRLRAGTSQLRPSQAEPAPALACSGCPPQQDTAFHPCADPGGAQSARCPGARPTWPLTAGDLKQLRCRP